MLSLGFGQGEDIVMNSRYQTVARITGGNGLQADLHDFQIAPHDVAYITAYNPIRCDLTPSKGRADGAIVDTAIQEIDMKTGLVRWEWHSLDHVGASESEVEAPTEPTPWDYFHLNSIDPEPDGEHPDLGAQHLGRLSARRRAAARSSGAWAATRAPSRWARARRRPGSTTAACSPDGEVTLLRRRLEPADPPPVARRADRARLQDPRGAPRLRLHAPDPPLLAASQGNMQTLADGNTVVGYGGVPAISEYATDGSLLFDAHLPFDMSFYRAFRFPWSGRPLSPPAVLASLNNTGEETIVHASWNGATEVASWRVLAGKHARVADGAGHDPGERLRELDDPAREVRLRGGAGARLRPAACSATSQTVAVDQLRRLAAAPWRSGAAERSVGRFGLVLVRRGGRRAGCCSSSVVAVEELAALPPHPATATVLARTASSVSMAVSGVLFIGRAPIVARGLGGSPYQAFAAPIARRRSRHERRDDRRARRSPRRPRAESEQGSGSAWLLAVCCVAQFMVILDLSIVNVALPSIQSSLGFSSPDLQWVVDAYAITFAGFLMLGGRAADHFGQRRTFVVALLLFGLASLAGGVAPEPGSARRRARACRASAAR